MALPDNGDRKLKEVFSKSRKEIEKEDEIKLYLSPGMEGHLEMPYLSLDDIKLFEEMPSTSSEKGPSTTPFQKEPSTTPFQKELSTTPFQKGASTAPSKTGPSITPFQKGPSITPFQKGPSITPFQKGLSTPPSKKGPSITPSKKGPLTPPSKEGQRTLGWSFQIKQFHMPFGRWPPIEEKYPTMRPFHYMPPIEWQHREHMNHFDWDYPKHKHKFVFEQATKPPFPKAVNDGDTIILKVIGGAVGLMLALLIISALMGRKRRTRRGVVLTVEAGAFEQYLQTSKMTPFDPEDPGPLNDDLPPTYYECTLYSMNEYVSEVPPPYTNPEDYNQRRTSSQEDAPEMRTELVFENGRIIERLSFDANSETNQTRVTSIDNVKKHSITDLKEG